MSETDKHASSSHGNGHSNNKLTQDTRNYNQCRLASHLKINHKINYTDIIFLHSRN